MFKDSYIKISLFKSRLCIILFFDLFWSTFGKSQQKPLIFFFIKKWIKFSDISGLSSKKNNPKISLLHIDVDVYEPTKIILELLYDKISKKGVIIFDDYNVVQGETDAVNEFFKARGIKKQIQKFKNFISPSFFIK